MEVLKDWKGCKRPERKVLEGRYVRLEPFSTELHLDELQEVSSGPGAEQRFAYVWEVPTSKDELKKWMESVQHLEDPMLFAVRDKQTGTVGGRQGFLRINEAHGVAEIGYILWGPLISRRPAATEACYLFAKHLFDELGYRRFEWKCHNANVASKRAALRFGFVEEGIFRQNYVLKGANRDTAWFSIIDKEWPTVKEAFEKWLDPDNFDDQGVQKRRLETFRN